MFVRIVDGVASLEDTDNFTQFHVQGDNLPIDQILKTLGSLAASCDNDHVWLSQSGVEHMAARPAADPWHEEFAKMCAYADSKGWFNPDHTHLRAHIERETS